MSPEDRELVWAVVVLATSHGRALSFGDAQLELAGMSEEQVAIAKEFRDSRREESTCGCQVCVMLREGASWENVASHVLDELTEAQRVLGFTVRYHLAPKSELRPYGVDIRTVGFSDRIGRELQLLFSVSADRALKVFANLANLVDEGLKVTDGATVLGLFTNGWPVKLVHVIEDGEPLWRVILPDGAGVCDREKIDKAMADQYAGVNCG